MKVGVVGLWHLGCVTAACLAKAKHFVIGYDADIRVINELKKNKAPLFEPHLDDLIQETQKAGTLSFSHDPELLSSVDVIWIAYDTPVDDNDHADLDFVKNEIKKIVPFLKQDALLIVSSQMPIGSTRELIKIIPEIVKKNIRLACIPENLRLGKAITVFTQPDRFVVGLEDKNDQEIIKNLLGIYTDKFVWMSIESAEMTKHAINSFLSLSVTFINELANVCEKTGANAYEVEMGLKSEERIGPKAYLHPGGPITGGTLLRDIQYISTTAQKHTIKTPLISAVLESNDYHKMWVQRKLKALHSSLKGKKITVLGLTYKANTDTLRRSSIIETCQWLHEQGVSIYAYDPVVRALPAELADYIQLTNSLEEALHNPGDAIILGTEWPQFRTEIKAGNLQTKSCAVLDPSGFLLPLFEKGNPLPTHYYRVGCAV